MDEQAQAKLEAAAAEISRLREEIRQLQNAAREAEERRPGRPDLWYQAFLMLVGRGESLECAADLADSMVQAFTGRFGG
jgi:hypothetical protein